MTDKDKYSDYIDKAPAETDERCKLDSLKVRGFMELNKIDIQKQKI